MGLSGVVCVPWAEHYRVKKKRKKKEIRVEVWLGGWHYVAYGAVVVFPFASWVGGGTGESLAKAASPTPVLPSPQVPLPYFLLLPCYLFEIASPRL